MDNGLTRRHFFYGSLLAGAVPAVGFGSSPSLKMLGYKSPNEKLNVAAIGAGGQGASNIQAIAAENIVALCDVDDKNAARMFTAYPKAPKYRDFRQMLDKEGKNIDAVVIAIPDHMHATAGMWCMERGKHIYLQKPLVRTVFEARQMKLAAAKYGVATQMGNQGSAETGLRRAVEVIQAGVIGKPLELHVWTNRPIWPQGLERPKGQDPVPATLNWDCWLGPAAKRPYKKDIYDPFKWRGWYEFGTGALGDMACHTVNMPFRSLKLGYPKVVECELASRMYPETFPLTSRIRFEFPEREGLPPLKFWWYDGNPSQAFKPVRPPAEAVKEIISTMGKLPESGALVIGDKGKLFSPDDYGAQFFVAMKGQDELQQGNNHEACKAVPQSIPRSPGHMQEWFRMMKEGTPAYSNFDIAAYLTEIILLGCVALRVGKKLEWDGPNMKALNAPEAAQFVKREYRPGWAA